MAKPMVWDLVGDRYAIYTRDEWRARTLRLRRGVTEAVLVDGDATLVCEATDFDVDVDLDVLIESFAVVDGLWTPSDSIPVGTTIAAVTDISTIEMSAPADATVSGATSGIRISSMDLRDWTFLAQVRASDTSEEILASFTIDPVELVRGRLELSMAATETAKMLSGKYYWDLRAWDAAGTPDTWVRGRVEVVGGISR